jgi:hypothetical protein
MTMQHELQNLNGAASLYLMIGRIQSDVSHLATGLDVVSEKVDKLERNARRKIIPVPRGWMSSLTLKDMGGFLIGLAILLVAVAQRWELLGPLARAYGK